jgi:hypothetical protein
VDVERRAARSACGWERGASGFIDVYEAGVRLEVTLRLAAGAVRPRGTKGGGEAGGGVVGEEVGVVEALSAGDFRRGGFYSRVTFLMFRKMLPVHRYLRL